MCKCFKERWWGGVSGGRVGVGGGGGGGERDALTKLHSTAWMSHHAFLSAYVCTDILYYIGYHYVPFNWTAFCLAPARWTLRRPRINFMPGLLARRRNQSKFAKEQDATHDTVLFVERTPKKKMKGAGKKDPGCVFLNKHLAYLFYNGFAIMLICVFKCCLRQGADLSADSPSPGQFIL